MRQLQVRAAPRRGDHRLWRRLLAGPGVVDDPPPGQDLGQAPVHHLDLAKTANHDVRGLQIAVDHPPGVGIRHRLGDVLEDRQEPGQVGRRVRPAPEQVGQGPALHQLHAEERPPVGEGAQLVDRDHAGVLELAADLRLLNEPSDQVAVVAEVLAEDLDRDVAADVGVSASQDGAHAAPGDLAVDPVAGRGLNAAGRPDHRRGHLAERGVPEHHARHGPDRGVDRLEDRSRPGGQVEGVAGLAHGRAGPVDARYHP